MARLADEESSIGEWIAALGPADDADLRGRAVERVTQFVECFPPLRRTWHPMTEAQVRWPLDGPILLRAKADLVIGRPAGAESRKLLIDLKSGRIYDRHREDLRFYALVETLAREVPPRSVASFSLEAGEAVVDQVNEAHAADVAAPHARRHRADDRARPSRADRRGRCRAPAASAAATSPSSPDRSRRQVMTWTSSPTARRSQTASASAGRTRMHPDEAPNSACVPTVSSGWASVPSRVAGHGVEADAGALVLATGERHEVVERCSVRPP